MKSSSVISPTNLRIAIAAQQVLRGERYVAV